MGTLLVVGMQNRYNGYLSFDALFSILPIVLMLIYTINITSYLTEDTRDRVDRQILFDKLVSIGDYVVKAGAAVHETTLFGDTTFYPNWVSEASLFSLSRQDIADKAEVDDLYIGFDRQDDLTCIYRLVAMGPDRDKLQIRKLYVCGDDNADD